MYNAATWIGLPFCRSIEFEKRILADYIIDLGPEGGDRGGELVAVGTPEEICSVKTSFTGQVLKEFFEDHYQKDC